MGKLTDTFRGLEPLVATNIDRLLELNKELNEIKSMLYIDICQYATAKQNEMYTEDYKDIIDLTKKEMIELTTNEEQLGLLFNLQAMQEIHDKLGVVVATA